jgi:hypothetical protein
MSSPGSGFFCESGLRLIQQNVSQCVDTFPSCDLSVAEAEQCMRRQRVDRCFEEAESASCVPLQRCLWRLVVTQSLDAGGQCDALQHRWTVALTARSSAGARARLLDRAERASSEPLRCRGSDVYVRIDGASLHAMFGRHLTLQGAPGAGNSSTSCGWFAELTPNDFVPAEFSADARRAELITDAKLELVRGLHACR